MGIPRLQPRTACGFTPRLSVGRNCDGMGGAGDGLTSSGFAAAVPLSQPRRQGEQGYLREPTRLPFTIYNAAISTLIALIKRWASDRAVPNLLRGSGNYIVNATHRAILRRWPCTGKAASLAPISTTPTRSSQRCCAEVSGRARRKLRHSSTINRRAQAKRRHR
jgi:hypothetical protein